MTSGYRRGVSTVLVVVGVVVIVGVIGMAITGIRIANELRVLALWSSQLEELSCESREVVYAELPLLERYGTVRDTGELSNLLQKESDDEFQSALDQLGSGVADELRRMSRLASERFEVDWHEDMEGLALPQPEMFDLRRTNESVHFLSVRHLSLSLAWAARLARLEGHRQEAVRTAATILTLARQMLSHERQHVGQTLIATMVSLNVVRDAVKELRTAGRSVRFHERYFGEVLPRLEEVDDLFSLVGSAMALERTMVPAFVEMQQDAAEKQGLRPLIQLDEVFRRGDRYFPPAEVYELPLVEAEPEIRRFVHRVPSRGAFYPLWAIVRPLDAFINMQIEISVPNVVAAYQRETELRAMLRGLYVEAAVEDYRRRNDRLPATLDDVVAGAAALGAHESMFVDPLSGEAFVYRVDGDDYTLESWSYAGEEPVVRR